MRMGNFSFDLAEQRAEQEREAGIARAKAALRTEGKFYCVACGEEIDAGRRKAFPAARRCIECQRRLERQRRRKWTSN